MAESLKKLKWLRKKGLFLCLFFFLGLSSEGSPLSLKILGGMFFPTDPSFREIYGKGTISGVEATIELSKKFDFWVRATYFFKRGQLTLTREKTQVEIIPIGYGLRYKIFWKKLSFYGGVGLDYYVFTETNPLGNVEWGDVGYSLRGGVCLDIFKGMVADLFLNYSRCQIQPADYEVNLGGFQIILSLGYHF